MQARDSYSIDLYDVPVALLAGGLATRLRSVAAAIAQGDGRGRRAGRSSIISLRCFAGRGCGGRAVPRAPGPQVESHLGDGSAHGLALRVFPRRARAARHRRCAPPGLPAAGRTLLGRLRRFVRRYRFRCRCLRRSRQGAAGLMTVLQNDDRGTRATSSSRTAGCCAMTSSTVRPTCITSITASRS